MWREACKNKLEATKRQKERVEKEYINIVNENEKEQKDGETHMLKL